MSQTLATITLLCPSCGGKANYTPGADRFTCPYCGNEHLFTLSSGGERTRVSATPVAVGAANELPLPGVRGEGYVHPDGMVGDVGVRESRPLPTPRPGNVIVEKSSAGLELSWRWFGPKYIFLGLFALFWDASYACGSGRRW